jgi:anti-sigma regulatory factor (Ser/Thr protein kinase)
MISLAIHEESQIADARRQVTALARQQGFNDEDAGRVALVATELGTNLTKHAVQGEILASAYEDDGENGIALIALDRGPGIVNVRACLADGYSSAGTGGHGLGAIIRQSKFVDIVSWPGVGTAILALIGAGESNRASSLPRSAIAFGAVSIPKEGETVCGDSWAIDRDGATTTLMVADGLGHGPDAAEASVEAVRLFRRFHSHQVPALLDYVHGGLRATRGAAVSMARYDPQSGQVVFGGVGNVAGVLSVRTELRRMVSMPGTAGYSVRKIQSFQYPFTGGLVILASDGLSTTWTLQKYPNIEAADPTLIAAVLYRDFGRRRDDITEKSQGHWLGIALVAVIGRADRRNVARRKRDRPRLHFHARHSRGVRRRHGNLAVKRAIAKTRARHR